MHFQSHPFACLFELFAFWDVVLCLLHIFMSAQHTLLDVAHQFTLNNTKEKQSL